MAATPRQRVRRALLTAIGALSLPACGGVYLEIGGVPVAISLVAVAQSPTQVVLTWSAYSGGLEYAVQRDGIEIARTAATSLVDAGAEPGERHCYVVYAMASTLEILARSNRDCVTMPDLSTGWRAYDLGDGRQASVALDIAGAARVCIAGDATPGLRHVASPAAGLRLVTVDTRPSGGCAIAVDGFGATHVAYGTDLGVRYATDATGPWVSTSVDGAGASGPLAIAIGADGRPAIAYARGSAVMLARQGALGWNRVTVLSAASPSLGPHRLGFAPDGEPRLLVASAEAGGTRLRLLRPDGIGWRSLLDRGGLPGPGGLALDASGNATVVHWRANTSAGDSGTAWELVAVTVPAATEVAGPSERIAVDSVPGDAPAAAVDGFGVRRVAWASATRRLELATHGQQGWVLQTVAAGDFDAVDAGVDFAGAVHLVHRDRADASIIYRVR